MFYFWNHHLYLETYLYIVWVGNDALHWGDQDQVLEKIQRSRRFMADVLELRDIPDLEGEESDDIKLSRVQELVLRPYYLYVLYPQIFSYIYIYMFQYLTLTFIYMYTCL